MSAFFAKNRSEVCDMCITEYNEVQHLENVKQEGIEQGQSSILDILDYINANPTKTDIEVASNLNCKESLVKETRKRIIK